LRNAHHHAKSCFATFFAPTTILAPMVGNGEVILGPDLFGGRVSSELSEKLETHKRDAKLTYSRDMVIVAVHVWQELQE
jgi:hypothetical protein